MTVAAFKPTSPPVIPTPETFLEQIVAMKCDIIICVPSFIEVCSKYERLPTSSRTLVDLDLVPQSRKSACIAVVERHCETSYMSFCLVYRSLVTKGLFWCTDQ